MTGKQRSLEDTVKLRQTLPAAALGLAFLASVGHALPTARPTTHAQVRPTVTTGPAGHVLLISVDGLHAADLARYVQTHPNSALAALSAAGVTYPNASCTRPSDSFPGMVALVTGGSPKSAGVYYDDSYDRSLFPPVNNATNPNLGVNHQPGGPGTECLYQEFDDADYTLLNGGGGIDPNNLPQEVVKGGLAPLYPHNFLRDNTIFQVVRAAGGYTAWSDKHPAYDLLNGPDTAHQPAFGTDTPGINDFFGPEINSVIAVVGGRIADRTTAPGVLTSPSAGTDGTTAVVNTEAYDFLKVQAILSEIDGRRHDGTGTAPVPSVFGMNFQSVSVGQKLTTEPAPVAGADPDPLTGQHGGYTDAVGTPAPLLVSALDFVDHSLGLMVTEMKKTPGLFENTTIIVSAKHGQSPMNKALLRTKKAGTTVSPLGPVQDPGDQLGAAGLSAQVTTDDIALIWLNPGASTSAAVSLLNADRKADGIQAVLSGPSITYLLGDPSTDPRTPNLVAVPNPGVIYTGSTKKVAEHGGFTHDDTNVALLVAGAGVSSTGLNTQYVETTQVAPTILKLLGLNPNALKAVQVEGTKTLPGF